MIRVRVNQKKHKGAFFRAGMQFDGEWREVDADEATQAVLFGEQMLEVEFLNDGGHGIDVGGGHAGTGSNDTDAGADGGGSLDGDGSPAEEPKQTKKAK